MRRTLSFERIGFGTMFAIGALIVLAVVAFWFFIAVPSAAGPARIVANGHVINVEIADTPTAHVRGLSGRTSLADGWGMLFVFPERDIHSFWMGGMTFPLDILWIDDHRVVEVVTLDAPTAARPIPASHTPSSVAEWVLELNAGEAERMGIRPGTRIEGWTR
jgi:hypothetical protein